MILAGIWTNYLDELRGVKKYPVTGPSTGTGTGTGRKIATGAESLTSMM